MLPFAVARVTVAVSAAAMGAGALVGQPAEPAPVLAAGVGVALPEHAPSRSTAAPARATGRRSDRTLMRRPPWRRGTRCGRRGEPLRLSLIHISEPTRLGM